MIDPLQIDTVRYCKVPVELLREPVNLSRLRKGIEEGVSRVLIEVGMRKWLI